MSHVAPSQLTPSWSSLSCISTSPVVKSTNHPQTFSLGVTNFVPLEPVCPAHGQSLFKYLCPRAPEKLYRWSKRNPFKYTILSILIRPLTFRYLQMDSVSIQQFLQNLFRCIRNPIPLTRQLLYTAIYKFSRSDHVCILSLVHHHPWRGGSQNRISPQMVTEPETDWMFDWMFSLDRGVS